VASASRPKSTGSGGRDDRRHEKDSEDQRSRSQKDRDRLLYSTNLRRLAGVTQVASATEVDIFHNRLTHTLKVAQVSRRIAEKLLRDNASLAEKLGGLDPEVVESAALSHDLGHPPFGHIAEKMLDKCLQKHKATDGYEGNAQSFRIITRLAFCRPDFAGLNLTRATLNATLKYPWFRTAAGAHNKKFGAYQSERDDLQFARGENATERKSVEAEIMDWSDDITYSVHDLEDFHEAGLIPLDRLVADPEERELFFKRTRERWTEIDHPDLPKFDDHTAAFTALVKYLPRGPYRSPIELREAIKPVISKLVKDFVFAIKLNEPSGDDEALVSIARDKKLEITMLKELTWCYVIRRPALAIQQQGQRKIIESLFDFYFEALEDKKFDRIPPWFKVNPESLKKEADNARIAADIVSSLTDGQAHLQYLRLNGISPGSIRDWI
jgi:dGTPase